MILLMCSILLTTFCEQIRYRSGFVSNSKFKSHVGLHSHLRNHNKLKIKSGNKFGSKAKSFLKNHNSKIAPTDPIEPPKLNKVLNQYSFKAQTTLQTQTKTSTKTKDMNMV
jgi:hypothetical protein